MLTAEFHSIDVQSIIVDRERRQRRELTDIEDLAASLAARGQINPIVIERESHLLIAGERRLAAAKLLGWTHIVAQYADELDERELKLIELEENTKRSNLTWQEQVLAIQSYHEIRKTEDDWTIDKTADELGYSPKHIKQTLQIAREMSTDPEIAEAPRLSIASNIVSRRLERRAASELAEAGLAPKQESEAIQVADFLKWAPTYDGPKFNFIHCDFPYGIRADRIQQGYTVLQHGEYEDTRANYFLLLGALCDYTELLCEEQAHLIFWFSMDYYLETEQMLLDTGWRVNPFPLIWIKNGQGIVPDAQRGPRRTYETAFFASRGDRKIVRTVANATLANVTRELHMSEKPAPMLEHFFRMVIDASSTVLDPTCGSGSALRVAHRLGATRVLGLEVNPEFAARAAEAFEKEKANGPSRST